jgi:hypothetical protein
VNGVSANTELLLTTAPLCLGAALSRIGMDNLQEMERECDALIQRASLLSTYLGARGADGCGDHGHEVALRYAQKQVKRIRKAIGYTYP